MVFTENALQARIISGGGPITDNVWKNGDAAASAIVPGQWLFKQNDGDVGLCTANSGGGIHLVSMHARTTAQTGYISVQEILPATVFEMQLSHATPASSNPTDAMKGDRYQIEVNSGIITINLQLTDTPDVEILEIWDDWMPYAVNADGGGNYGLVRAKVITTRIELAAGTG